MLRELPWVPLPSKLKKYREPSRWPESTAFPLTAEVSETTAEESGCSYRVADLLFLSWPSLTFPSTRPKAHSW